MANTALDILVDKLFDYSGMFPPEGKSLLEALKESAQFRNSLTRPFMVNTDIVLTEASINSISDSLLQEAGFATSHELSIAFLGSDLKDSEAAISAEIDRIESFNAQGADAQYPRKITSYEIKIGECSEKTIAIIQKNIQKFTNLSVSVSLEPDLSTDSWQEVLKRAILLVSSNVAQVSLKSRGTGPTGIGNDKFAFVIASVCDSKINFKATGGLHHPFLEDIYGNNLGFLGLTTALYLRHSLGEEFSVDDIMRCLCASDPSQMELEIFLGWGEKNVELKTLKDIKERFRFSIGSCSLREPDEDLVRILG